VARMQAEPFAPMIYAVASTVGVVIPLSIAALDASLIMATAGSNSLYLLIED
jgi:hypothetical protein